MERIPKTGEVYLMSFSGEYHEQRGLRPGVVIQNNTGNRFSPNIIAIPLSSSLKKSNMPTHVIIRSSNSGLKYDSLAICENPERMAKEHVGAYITTLNAEYMAKISMAYYRASALLAYIDIEEVITLWREAIADQK